MPLPAAAVPALIGAASNAAGGTLNALTTVHTNKQSRKWSERMYNVQKNDNLEFWRMQNEYNSPQAQMQRFQEAGLNPNLIYGQGNAGNAGAISTPDVQPAQFRSPEWGNAVSTAGLAYINAIYDLDIKQAQIDNLKAQNTVIKYQGVLNAVNARRGEFDLGFAQDMRDVSADAMRERLRQTKVYTDVAIDRNAREAVSNAYSVQESVERMNNLIEQRLNMAQQRAQSRAEVQRIEQDRQRIRENINLMKREIDLKDMDIKLRRDGLNPSDPTWMRLVGKFLADVYNSDDSFGASVWKSLFGN